MKTISKYLVNFDGNYDFDDLKEIVRILRAPGGCPWDRQQTHESIRKNFIEETYEAIEAIDNKDAELLEEELGDVLLQVLLHAEMEEESGIFGIRDVVDGICKKLILRHPHVFGDVSAETSEQVLKNWDEIKKKEKSQKNESEVLNSVAKSLPALMRAVKLQHKASKAGFDWDDYSGALEKIKEETSELELAIKNNDQPNIEEELGDLLFSVVNVCRFFKVEPEEALTKTSDKFVSRFSKVEKLAAGQGRDMKEMTLEELDKLWEKSKG
ncbi:MAG: nucleoside triphosphate pyrophosphohydrolase [Bacillota bacterium]|nr:nucleoside triphosphate pyrophosphohydrolase [Bacillota bacterium]